MIIVYSVSLFEIWYIAQDSCEFESQSGFAINT